MRPEETLKNQCPCLSPPMPTRPSSETITTMARLVPLGSGLGEGESGHSREPSLSAPTPSGSPIKANPCLSLPMATQPSLEGTLIKVTLVPLGSGQGVGESGHNRDPSWLAWTSWVALLTKANPCPSPPTVTRPSSAGSATTVTLGPRGFGLEAEESGLSRAPNWSARVPWGMLNKAFPCPSPPTATRPLLGAAKTPAWAPGLGPRGSGREAKESGSNNPPNWSARAPQPGVTDGSLNKASPCPSPPT